MALKITPREARNLIDFGSNDGKVVCTLQDHTAYLIFKVDKDLAPELVGGCHVMVVEADEPWMQEFMRLSRAIVRSDVMETFIQGMETWWPGDPATARMRALFEFGRPPL